MDTQDFFEQAQGEKKEPRTFDVCVMNPPYQDQSGSIGSGQGLWPKFVSKALEIVKKDGYIAAIHPSGWRGNVSLSELGFSMKSKQIKYLEIHHEQDGQKVFGATTRYDWYVMQNSPNSGKTVIKDQNGEVSKIHTNTMGFIPNMLIDKIYSFVAGENEEKVDILSDYNYSTMKDIMSKSKDEVFIYPVIYTTTKSGPSIWYSKINTNGHFGVKKIIFNPNRPIGFVKDYNGEYAMSEYCVGIVCDSDSMIDRIAKVFENQKTNGFAEVMESCHYTNKVFNKYIVSLFRRDFWKEFV